LGNFLWRVFLFVCPGSSLILLLNHKKSISIKRKKQCAACGLDKKHDEKNYRRVGVGEVNKRQRECQFFFGTAGFYLLWGVSACGIYCNGW
jgi:hypothetical protein